MSPEEFTQLDMRGKAQHLNEHSEIVNHRYAGSMHVFLHKTEDFFAEVFFSDELDRIQDIKVFDSTKYFFYYSSSGDRDKTVN